MPSLNIRRLDDDTHTRLRVRAAQNGRSMEEEARRIIQSAVNPPRATGPDLAKWLSRRAVERSGGKASDVDSVDLIREGRER